MNNLLKTILITIAGLIVMAVGVIVTSIFSYEAGFTDGAHAYGYNGYDIEFHWGGGYPPMTVGQAPQFIALDAEPLPPTIIPLYPFYGINNIDKEYVVIFGVDNINVQNPPEGFPLRTEIKNGRFIIYVPFENNE